ncbi:MAG: hypothetical protein AABY22_20955, partial [Nanoarchaeota archaeon]
MLKFKNFKELIKKCAFCDFCKKERDFEIKLENPNYTYLNFTYSLDKDIFTITLPMSSDCASTATKILINIENNHYDVVHNGKYFNGFEFIIVAKCGVCLGSSYSDGMF